MSATQKADQPQLQDTAQYLKALATIAIAKEFYDKDQRKELLAELAALYAEDKAAYGELMRSTKGEDRGKEKHIETLHTRGKTSGAVDAFQERHPIIASLYRFRRGFFPDYSNITRKA